MPSVFELLVFTAAQLWSKMPANPQPLRDVGKSSFPNKFRMVLAAVAAVLLHADKKTSTSSGLQKKLTITTGISKYPRISNDTFRPNRSGKILAKKAAIKQLAWMRDGQASLRFWTKHKNHNKHSFMQPNLVNERLQEIVFTIFSRRFILLRKNARL